MALAGLVACGGERASDSTASDGAPTGGTIGALGRPTGHGPAMAEALATRLADDPLALLREQPPERDLGDLSLRLGRLDPALYREVPRTVEGPVPERTVGDVERFWVHDIQNDRYFEVDARLEIITPEAYFWVQEDQGFDREGLQRGATIFSQKIVPTLRARFGHEWSPGVDRDPRMHVLHHEPIAGVAGFYSSSDEFTTAVEPYSNQREMFYINLQSYAPGSSDYLQLLAHELQHMIHWHHDRGEPVWSNEGLSELAPYLVGHGRQTGGALISRPDTQLTRWEATGGGNGVHYAASFLYFAWLWGQHGDDLLKAIVASPGNGEAGVEAALAEIGHPQSFEQSFLDWSVANLLNDPQIADGRYGYRDVSVRRVSPSLLPPMGADTTVHQFGTDYWNVTGLVRDGTLDLRFEGETVVGLLDASSAAHGHVWWSNRGDDMDSHLTRELDLRDVTEAELRFRSWWSIEEGWDYGYLLASTDDGRTWQPLANEHTTTANPNGNSFGAARTGESAGWVDERVDLTRFAGQRVLLRFEMITDDAVSLGGWAIDDLVLPATGFEDDVDGPPDGHSGWSSAGWLPLDPRLPQRWGVQLVVRTGDDAEVTRIRVAPDGDARLQLSGVPSNARVTVIVSALTHATRNSGFYRLWDPATGTPPVGYP